MKKKKDNIGKKENENKEEDKKELDKKKIKEEINDIISKKNVI